VEFPVGESGRSSNQGVDGLVGEKDRVTGGFGELLDAGSDVDGVTDQGELELAPAADGAGDHQTGVDADADPTRAAESLGNETVNQKLCTPISATAVPTAAPRIAYWKSRDPVVPTITPTTTKRRATKAALPTAARAPVTRAQV
jgi:hypothetical protein